MRAASEGGPGFRGQKAQMKLVKNRADWVFLFERIPQVSTC